MRQMYIPPLKSQITLAQDWSFTVYPEERNKSLYAAYNKKLEPVIGSYPIRYNIPSFIATLPADTVLTIDRIFIRKGAEDFDSITFIIESSPNPDFRPKKKVRFWVKLDDANNILFN